MEKFQQLTVTYSSTNAKSETMEFTKKIQGKIAESQDWEEIEANPNRLKLEGEVAIFKFNYLKEPNATLTLTHGPAGKLEVPHISPIKNGDIGVAGFNTVLLKFKSDILDPIIGSLDKKPDIMVKNFPAGFETTLPSEVVKALKAYHALVNRGEHHPVDEQKWRHFIITAHLHNAKLFRNDLKTILIQEFEWGEDRAAELSSHYEFGRDLLKQYDEYR